LYVGNPLGALVTFVVSASISGRKPSVMLYFWGEIFGCGVHMNKYEQQ
jgi:hypothetical protein